MRVFRLLASAVLTSTIVICASITIAAQTSDGNIANVSGGGSTVRWDITTANSGATLTVTFPDGRALRRTFKAGASPQLIIGDKQFSSLPDGVYTYELQLAPVLSPGMKESAAKTRGQDDDPESERMGRKRLTISAPIQSGSFAVINGSIIVAGSSEPDGRTAAKSPAKETLTPTLDQRIRNNHRAFFKPDFVIADDLVVQGSACVGLDCVNGEVFGFDTIRVKENNTRFQFDDTSTSAGFATNNWQIRANAQGSGGGSFLAFVDQGATGNSETGTLVFQVDAGAPANSLRVSSGGNVGIGTATPVLDVHANTSDTPAIRLEQNNSGGFTAQTWDIGANEANFFVRDVTSGSRLPFRIRPGAPTSSIDISADGDVGVNTASPAAQLHVLSSDNNEFAAEFEQTNATASNGVFIKTQTANAGDVALNVLSNNGATTVISARNNGRVGIGTGAPDQLLSVNGDASKALGGGSWQVFSDERLKNIKGRFDLGLNAVMQLQPFRYTYKPNNALGINTAGEHIGFRAQELQKVIPDAVSMSNSGYLMVNNDPILWTMLNAIKEQQKEIAELKAEVRKLKANSRRHSNRRR